MSLPSADPLSVLGLPVGAALLLNGETSQRQLGRRLAPLTPPGMLLFLEGELGAGKTTFSQGLALGLGFTDLVSSPTYALMQEYPTPQGRLLHVDAYRVRHPQELYEMDLERLVETARLSLIEWGESFYDDFPQAPVLRLEHVAGQPDVRQMLRVR
ncbi:tRNA (adenosine(37)-N6)-threonylcarbamoyltransferase complex ATPase subunit type 1 TsaE [Deinococcus radiomollis]|uniref:tRNA (adenosine(37)-N6)-threonylcarbamoyltransferase complex ATPase subunit type 1 TsaE n=1 Tax=Deinococcus radiomollis TaxID=468916 RepID=UPI003892B700